MTKLVREFLNKTFINFYRKIQGSFGKLVMFSSNSVKRVWILLFDKVKVGWGFRNYLDRVVGSINRWGYWFEYQRPKWYLFDKWSGWIKLPKIYEQIRSWLFDKGIEYQIGYHEFIARNITRHLVRKWFRRELLFYFHEYFLERLDKVYIVLPSEKNIDDKDQSIQLFWICWALVIWGVWESILVVRSLLLSLVLWPLGRLIDFIFHDIAHVFLENLWWKTLTNIAYLILIEWPESYRLKSFRFFIFVQNTGKRMLSYFLIRRALRASISWLRDSYAEVKYRLFFIRPMNKIARKMKFESFILDETQWKYSRNHTSAFYLLFLPFVNIRVSLRQRIVWMVDRFMSRRYMLFPIVCIKFVIVCFLLFILGWIISAQDFQYERIVSHYGWLIQAKKIGVFIGHNHTHMVLILILVLFHIFLLFFVIPMVFTRVLVQMRRRRTFREDPVILGIWNAGLKLYLFVERVKEILCDIIVLLVLISWFVGPFLILYLRHWVRVEHILPRMPTVYFFTYWYQFWQRGYDKYMHWMEPHLMDLRRFCVFIFRSYYIRFEAAVVRIYTYLHDLVLTLYDPIYELSMFYYKIYWVGHSTIYQWMEIKHPVEMALTLFEYAPHWHHNLNITYFWGFVGSTSGLYFFHRFWLRTVWYGSPYLQIEALQLTFKFCFFHMYGLFVIIVAPIICRYEPETVRLLVEHVVLSEWLLTG